MRNESKISEIVKDVTLLVLFIADVIYTIKTNSLAGAFWGGALAMLITMRYEEKLHKN